MLPEVATSRNVTGTTGVLALLATALVAGGEDIQNGFSRRVPEAGRYLQPDRWGDELLAHVAARFPATRRLLFTADNNPQRTVRELIERGVVEAWFQKPWTDALVEAIRGYEA